MKHVLGWVVFLFLMISGSAVLASSKHCTNTTLDELRRLVFINDDLHDKTQVTLSGDPESQDKSEVCFCSCRDHQWSCTYTECKLQDKECGEEKQAE